jgi:putative transposase
MIRCSEHILKYQTSFKSAWLDLLFNDYKEDLRFYIDLLWSKQLPLAKMLSSKVLPANNLKHSQYKQILYKQASEIIRSNIEKKKTSKPIVKNVSIDIDERLFDIVPSNKVFEEFIHLRLPYFQPDKKLAISINLPIKHHKHSRKFKSWKRANTIKLKQNADGRFYVIFTYEKETPIKRTVGKDLGVDQGYNKLLALSDGTYVGKEFKDLYELISKKEQGSKNFRDLLYERDKKINEAINKIDFSNVKVIVIEDLKNVKSNSRTKIKKRFYKKFMNKLQRWSYLKVIVKLERLCDENGILLIKVNPAYTSQTCSQCGSVDKQSRRGEMFKCTGCNFIADADYNASVNILHRGGIIPLLKGTDNV